jgi:hypothetical protein
LRLLHVQDAERALDSALDCFRRGEVSAQVLTARARALQTAADRARAVASLQAALERKYSPDQPRDDHGRWTSGGGDGRSRLSSTQRQTAAALRSVIATTAEITPNTFFTMQNNGLRLGDVLGPGIYQVEFTPQIAPPANIPLVGTAHSQFVFIDGAGNSHILSGKPGGPSGLQLSVVTGNFDGHGTHSLGSIVGQRNETISINNVTLPRGQESQIVWGKMNDLAKKIDSAELNYNAVGKNLNSLFFTLAKYNNIGVSVSAITPGRPLDLVSVMRTRALMKPPFTGVGNSANASH